LQLLEQTEADFTTGFFFKRNVRFHHVMLMGGGPS